MFTIADTTEQGTTYRGEFERQQTAQTTATALWLGDMSRSLVVVPLPAGITPEPQTAIYL